MSSEDQQPLRVLAVDDHPTNLLVLEAILGLVGANLTLARDGAEAVAAFAPARYDIILMDLQMPVMDGVHATQEIRRIEASSGAPRTPLLVVTANTLGEHVAAARAAGADHHIGKPVTPDSLLQAIEWTMSLGAPAEAARRVG